MTMIDGETPDPLDEFQTLGELLGFVDKRDGREAFKATLGAIVERGATRESMRSAACELKAAGKNQAADLAKAAAAQCPPMTDLRFCPYMQPPYTNNARDNQANIKMWLWGEWRRANKMREQCKALLRRAGVSPDWIDDKVRDIDDSAFDLEHRGRQTS